MAFSECYAWKQTRDHKCGLNASQLCAKQSSRWSCAPNATDRFEDRVETKVQQVTTNVQNQWFEETSCVAFATRDFIYFLACGRKLLASVPKIENEGSDSLLWMSFCPV